MSATNRRVRRAILEILYDGEGGMTREDVAVALGEYKGVDKIPSPHSLSALLKKSASTIVVGKKVVENLMGNRNKHNLYDVDRSIVKERSELKYMLEPSVMTPNEKAKASKCQSCSRTRIMPDDGDECLTCIRVSSVN